MTSFAKARLTAAVLGCVLGGVVWSTVEAATVRAATSIRASVRTRRVQSAPVKKSAPVRDATARKATTSRRPTRRASLAASRARAAAEVRTPRFKVGPTGESVPDVRAEAAIVYNPATGEVIYADHENDQRSIASITKVMTAVVFLDHELDLSRAVKVERSDVRGANVTYLRANDELTTEALLHLTLIGSDNAAARALARVSQFGSEWFIEEMNKKARELGLEHTVYADPSGLDAANVSSAFDMAKLIAFVSGHERIAEIMRKGTATVRTSRRAINVRSTNKLIGQVDVVAGKTGFIRKAGYCLATLLRAPQGEQYAVVVLGARSNAGRFWETRHLLNWLATRTVASTAGLATSDGAQHQQ